MTTRSKRQLEIPALARDAYLIAAVSPVDSTPTARDALASMAAALQADPQRLLGFVHSCCYGPGGEAAQVHDALDLAPQGYTVLGTDAAALFDAVKTVASGYSGCVLVAGGAGGSACALIADRETAQTLSPAPLRLQVSVAGPASDDAEADAIRIARALCGAADDPTAVDGDLLAHLSAMTHGLDTGHTRLALHRADVITAIALTA